MISITVKDTLILFTVVFFLSCGNSAKHVSIYKPGRVWNYSVTISDSLGNMVDTFSLIMTSRESSTMEKIIRPITVCYDYKIGDSLIQNECTGVVDNETSISLHPPREHALEFTEVTPFPSAHKKFKPDSWKWYKSESELHVQKASYFDKAKNQIVDLAGKVINQHLWAEDTTTVSYQDTEVFCYKLKGKNLNYLQELGEFNCTYFYNEKYGFIKWVYFPSWGEKVVISLKSTNF